MMNQRATNEEEDEAAKEVNCFWKSAFETENLGDPDPRLANTTHD